MKNKYAFMSLLVLAAIAGAQFSTVGDVQITFDNISVTNNDPAN